MNQSKPFFKTARGLLLLGFIVVSLVGIPVTVFLLQQQQIFQQEAWKTAQSASSTCGPDGKPIITASFTNTEPPGAQWAMNVTVRDTQTGLTTNIGTVKPGETKSGTITATASTLNAGGVVFNLTWTDGRSGVDTRTASYPAVAACSAPSNTPTPTTPETPTPTLPIETPTPTTPLDTPTPTLPVETPTPTVPGNTPTPTTTTETPTPTTAISSTPTPPSNPTTTPTNPPGPSTGPTDTPAPTTAIASNPTIAPSGPEDLLIGFGMISLLFIIAGGLIFILL